MSAPGNHHRSQSTAAQCTLTPAKRFKYLRIRVLKITWKQVQQKCHEARTGRQPTRHRNQKHEKSSFLLFKHARQINLLTRLAWWRVSSLHKHNRTILLWVLSLVLQDRKALYSTNIRLKKYALQLPEFQVFPRSFSYFYIQEEFCKFIHLFLLQRTKQQELAHKGSPTRYWGMKSCLKKTFKILGEKGT